MLLWQGSYDPHADLLSLWGIQAVAAKAGEGSSRDIPVSGALSREAGIDGDRIRGPDQRAATRQDLAEDPALLVSDAHHRDGRLRAAPFSLDVLQVSKEGYHAHHVL